MNMSYRNKQLLVIVGCLILEAVNALLLVRWSRMPITIPRGEMNSAAYRATIYLRAISASPFVRVPSVIFLLLLLYWPLRSGRKEYENLKLLGLGLAFISLISFALTSILKV